MMIVPQVTEWISIHAAREGGDAKPPKANKTFAISIHAAREGGDDVRYTIGN